MTDTALVTGGARRLGKAIALHLAQQGYSIALHYHHSEQDAQALAQEIRSMGGVCHCYQADLSEPLAAKQLVESIGTNDIQISLLINNASCYYAKDLHQTTLCDWEQMFALHLRTPFFLTQELVKQSPNGGHIINLIDAEVATNKTRYFPYLLSKKGLADFTRMAALELAPLWRVNGINPGYMMAPIDNSITNPASVISKIPLHRQGKPHQVVQALAYLLDNDFVTGQILTVDGGATL